MHNLAYLINPSEQNILVDAGDRMPLGLLCVAQRLEHSSKVKVFDMNHDLEYTLLEELKKDKPGFIGISCLTSPMLKETKRLGKVVRENSDGYIIVGGYHPSVCPEDFLDFDVTHYGQVEQTNPARHFLDATQYNMMLMGYRTTTMFTSLGCPNNCVFCGNLNHNVKFRKLEDIEKELDTIVKDEYGAVYFLDDVFTINKDRAKQIGKMCKDRGLKYRATTRANYMDRDLVKSFSDTDCILLSMGVESGNEIILKQVGKNQTKEQIREATKLCGEYGIGTKGFFIIGLPNDTEDTVKETLDFAKELKSYGMLSQDFYPLVPFPGTDIWRNPDKYGITIFDKDYSNYLQATRGEPKVVCETKGLKADRIKQILMEQK